LTDLAKNLKTLDVRSRRQWRDWLARRHESESEVWLVFHKCHTGQKCISYDDAVEEALCFGWIDSLIRRLDEDRFARKFTPRKPDSKWSTINRQRYEKLKENGLLAAPGLERPPTDRSGDAPPRRDWTTLPAYIEEQLKANAPAWGHFEKMTPSCRRAYIGWIDSAKREETKHGRLRQAIAQLATGQKLGLK